MIRFRSARWWLLGCLAVCVSPLWGQPPQPAPAPPLSQVKLPARPEPLDQLRDALQTLVLDNTNREEYAFRKTKLEKAIHGLRPADYGPALALPEWRDLDRDEGVAAVDRPLRRDLIQRYRDWVVKVLQQRGADSVDVKLAVLTQAARLANHARGEAAKSVVVSDLTPAVIAAIQDADGDVRRAAARTLGRIYPYPEPAVAALAKMLGGKEVAERRAAAEALAALAQLVEGQARNRVNGGSLLEWTVPEIVQRGQLLTVAAGRGLGDSDALVKRHCLAALQATAKTMHALLGELPKREDFPPTGRKATPAEQQQLVALEGQLVEVRKQLKPLIEALNEVVKPSAALLNDPEADVVQAACAALEELAATRQRGRQREAAFAAILQVANLKPPAIPLLDPLSQTVPALAGVLAHPEVRVRLGALYVLETLEAEAVAATPALVKACGDGDAFVRWGAARALGKLAPAESKAVVPALGKLASDPNGDVRITALAALERFGPSAAAAVAALGPVAAKGDVPTRLWAMRALAAIGKEAQGAVPSLTTALAATEPAVREAAARTLGKVGHGSAEARKVLRQALDDANGDVQEAAAQALLNLQ